MQNSSRASFYNYSAVSFSCSSRCSFRKTYSIISVRLFRLVFFTFRCIYSLSAYKI